jgi:hypothetical protein
MEFPGYSQRSDKEMNGTRRFLGYNRVRNGFATVNLGGVDVFNIGLVIVELNT